MSRRTDIPKLETKWKHHNGAEYEVYDVTNADADTGRELDHPVSISYKGANGKRWSKPLDVFLKKMTPLVDSAWVERQVRIHAECAVAFDVEEPAQPGKPRILSSLHQVLEEPTKLEYPVPTFHYVYSLTNFVPKVGAALFVDATYTGDGIIEDDCHALVVDCWNAQGSYNHRAVNSAARPHLERWQFCTMTRVQHAEAFKHGIGVITNHNLPGPGNKYHIIMPPPPSSLGGQVLVLATLAALLRQIAKEFVNELADATTLRNIQLRFNELANAEINYSRATAFGVPQIVYPSGECPKILLPAGIRNRMGLLVEPPAEYADIYFENHRLIVNLPRDITECMTALFGPDFLMGILRD